MIRASLAALAVGFGLGATSLPVSSARADEATTSPSSLESPAAVPSAPGPRLEPPLAPQGPPAAAPSRARSEGAPIPPQRLAGIVAASGGLALVVVGGVLFGFATDRAAQIEDAPGTCSLQGEFPRRCANAADAARLSALSSEGQAFATSAWVLLGVGVAGVAAGALLIVTAPGGALGGAVVRPSASPTGAALAAQWAF